MPSQRVIENLNLGLHTLFERHETVSLLGEDVLDPYGGAFKASKGLSTKYPDRVISTPLSEGGFVGVAAGMALCGEKPIVEIMFGDFITLAFDQIVNFAAKSVSMYGTELSLNLVVRCPIGGNRSYGPTHSQSLQKHFLGVPNLDLFEISQFHDNAVVLEKLVGLGRPSILFEDKVLYTQRMYDVGIIDEIFGFEKCGDDNDFVRVFSRDFDKPHCLLITTGGLVPRCLSAMRELFVEHEIECEMMVPSRVYPLDLRSLEPAVAVMEHIFVVEEGTPGGSWGSEVSHNISRNFWDQLEHPITIIQARDSIIPSARHLEEKVLVQSGRIVNEIKSRVRHA